jgi:hypothetical protein
VEGILASEGKGRIGGIMIQARKAITVQRKGDRMDRKRKRRTKPREPSFTPPILLFT